MLPEECLVYEYLITASNQTLPARPISNEIVSRQAQERTEFLKEKAKFKSIRLIVTLYMPGKVVDEAEEFSQHSRCILRQIQNAALIYEQALRMVKIQRLLPDELVQIYSYLLNLDRSLMTRHKSARPGETKKKLGRVHIGMEGDYFRSRKAVLPDAFVDRTAARDAARFVGRIARRRLRNGVVFHLATEAEQDHPE